MSCLGPQYYDSKQTSMLLNSLNDAYSSQAIAINKFYAKPHCSAIRRAETETKEEEGWRRRIQGTCTKIEGGAVTALKGRYICELEKNGQGADEIVAQVWRDGEDESVCYPVPSIISSFITLTQFLSLVKLERGMAGRR